VELLMALREELNHDGSEYAFTDDEILGPLGELHRALPRRPRRSLTIAMPTCWQCKTALSTGRSLNDGLFF
jgi:DNA-binding MltR family transcriptional regulator